MESEKLPLSQIYRDLLQRLDKLLQDDCELTKNIVLAQGIHAAWLRIRNWGNDIGEEQSNVLDRLQKLSFLTAEIVHNRLIAVSRPLGEVETLVTKNGQSDSQQLRYAAL